MSETRFWVNWDDNPDRTKETPRNMVALVDEEEGGEVAFFPNEDRANWIAERLNLLSQVQFQTDLNGEQYVCGCDDVRACGACFDAAELYVGKVIESSNGTIFEVAEIGDKDDCPTLDGVSHWTRPYDVTVLADSEEDAKGKARCDDCHSVWDLVELAEPDRLAERLDPGGMVPAGECPECGALAYPLEALMAD